jgi:hypothetical protein
MIIFMILFDDIYENIYDNIYDDIYENIYENIYDNIDMIGRVVRTSPWSCTLRCTVQVRCSTGATGLLKTWK